MAIPRTIDPAARAIPDMLPLKSVMVVTASNPPKITGSIIIKGTRFRLKKKPINNSSVTIVMVRVSAVSFFNCLALQTAATVPP